MKISLVTKKNKLKNLSLIAEKLNKAKSEYGFFKEQGMHYSGYSYATLMAIHEYGSGRIPARKPFAIALFENKTSILKFTLKSLNKCVMSASETLRSPEGTLNTFGSLGVYHTRNLFGSSKLLPNALPIRKGSGSLTSTPLVDFGDLKANIAYRNSENSEIKT